MKINVSNTRTKRFWNRKVFNLITLFLLINLISVKVIGGPTHHEVPTYVGPIPNVDIKSGWVMARSIILDQNGNPILVEFDDKGKEVEKIDIGNTDIGKISIIQAVDYRTLDLQLQNFRMQYKDSLAKGAELLSRAEYEQSTFLMADGITIIDKHPLDEGVNSVFVRGQSSRLVDVNQSDGLVLLKFHLDMTQDADISVSTRSLVINDRGQIIAKSKYNIAYRTGFFGDPNEPQDDRAYQVDPTEDIVFGPLKNVEVYIDKDVYKSGVSTTDKYGKYRFQYNLPSCPVGGFTYSTDVTAELKYRNNLPTGAPSIPYYLRTPGYTYCYADLVPYFLVPEIQGIIAGYATVAYQSNLIADVMFVTGSIVLKNTRGEDVELGETTRTSFDEDASDKIQYFYDFNGDNEIDYILQGLLYTCVRDETPGSPRIEVDVFRSDDAGGGDPEGYQCEEARTKLGADGETTESTSVQAIFFDGSQDDEFDFPDLVRIIDKKTRNEPMGVLGSISVDDLKNTDILFFRESTGQLIMERRGLKDAETKIRRVTEYDEENTEIDYRVMLRGRYDSTLNVGGGVKRSLGFEEWATEYQLNEPFQKRESDHPKPGEFIKIVAINRATGYVGTTRVQLKSPNENLGRIDEEDNQEEEISLLDVSAPTITMKPPNLKIWAERDYTVEHGYTAGEDRNYTIGNEGAALTSDTTIRIFTEWLDDKGNPLPDELGLADGYNYGFTGRFAKVVADNLLSKVSAGSDLSEFPIGPGRETHVIKVKDNLTTADHYYIHVIGKPKGQKCVLQGSCPSFNETGDEPPYDSRPELLTPFLTPLPDEDLQWLEYTTYRELLRAYESAEDNSSSIEPTKPLPAYSWQYRPEYQFSQYEFEVDKINRVQTVKDDNGDYGLVEDILESSIPSILTTDTLITVFYSLIANELNRLTPIDGTQELVLALGEEEILLTAKGNNLVVFNNLESLAKLDPEDYLTMRLYTNEDSANILWEWAFFINLEFVDRFYQPIKERSTASFPKPVIHLGIGNELNLVAGNHIQVNGDGKSGSLKLSGKVYCDIADITGSGLANIATVEINVARPITGGSETYTVALENISDFSVQDIRPFADDESINAIENEKHAFIGYFETTVALELASGTQQISVSAENAIGSLGVGSIGINVDGSQIGRYEVKGVVNNDRLKLDRGVFEPIWVRVIDDDITPENVIDKSVTFMGVEHSLQQHDDGRYYADKPFLFVTKPLRTVGIDNIRDVVTNPSAIEGEYDNEAGGPPKTGKLSSTYTIALEIMGERDWKPNTFTYAAGSTVSVFWATDPLEPGWEIIEGASDIHELNIKGYRRYLPSRLQSTRASDFQIDEDVTLLKIIERQRVNGKQVYQFVLRLDKDSDEFSDKRLSIYLSKTENDKEEYDSVTADFKVTPLKTVILAVDGLGYATAMELINGPDAKNFKKIFGQGKALGIDKPALSALPTITWANWPGVFSGGPPAEHGWLGNSYFPRESTSGNVIRGNFKYPVYSSGIEDPICLACGGLIMDVQQQIGVALGGVSSDATERDFSVFQLLKRGTGFGGVIYDLGKEALIASQTRHSYSMDQRSLDEAGSLYDIVANELEVKAEDKLNVHSVKVFYDRSKNRNVLKQSSYFTAFDTHSHSRQAAEYLDNGEFSTENFVTFGTYGSAPRARDRWRFHGNELDILSIYLPGTDNAGHTFGNADLDFQPIPSPDGEGTQHGIPILHDQAVDVVNPPDVLRQHASTVLDDGIGKLIQQIQDDGHQNAVLFAVTADHGQHAFKNTEQYVLMTSEVGRLFETPLDNGGMGMQFWDGFNYDEAQAVYSPNGAFGQFYLRANGKTWQDPPARQDVLRLAAILHRESIGTEDVQLLCEMRARKLGEICEEYDHELGITKLIQFNESASEGIYGRTPAIFVRIADSDASNHFMHDYRWVKAVSKISADGVVPVNYDVTLGSVDEFISASQKGPDQWPALKERIDELNHKYAFGSRTGDIITILNGEEGHLTVNNKGEVYAGWHGGPTRSESEVPLFFALLGDDFSNDSGEAVAIPEELRAGYLNGVSASNVKADGYLRNWHLTHVLKKILREYRVE